MRTEALAHRGIRTHEWPITPRKVGYVSPEEEGNRGLETSLCRASLNFSLSGGYDFFDSLSFDTLVQQYTSALAQAYVTP